MREIQIAKRILDAILIDAEGGLRSDGVHNDELQIVWSEVYAPLVPDTQGDFMTVEGIRLMAHGFLAAGKTCQVDVYHDNRCDDDQIGHSAGEIVESFVARKGDPDFIEDAWVVGVHIADDEVWKDIKDGKINGFSMQAEVHVREKILEIDIPDSGEVTGMTDVPSGANEGLAGHVHRYTLRFSEVGDIVGGETDTVAGHRHQIQAATVTEPPDGNPIGHVHRFSFLEALGRGSTVDGGMGSGEDMGF
jgi:hypothetical protein